MNELAALWLTLKLSLVSTALLMLFGAPLAWWLSRRRSRLTSVVEAIVAMPLVLPPTVLGFYLLLALGPEGIIGGTLNRNLAFSFEGLVIGSLVYSLPFVVQPMVAAFSSIRPAMLEAATTLGAAPLDRFFSLVLPQAKAGLLVAAVLGFAHCIGEFGVVLMIGGSIPEETRVISIAIYEAVERLDYAEAHRLSLGLVIGSFLLLLLVYQRRSPLSWIRPSSESARKGAQK